MSQNRGWEAVNPGETAAGAYSPGVRAGNLLFLSGQVPTDPVTGETVGSDVTAQTHAVFDRIERLLGHAGATLKDVVSVTVYLADINDWDAFNEAYKTRMTLPYPARTTVGAGLHGFLIEITVTAFLGETTG